jgi:hypothetical protein
MKIENIYEAASRLWEIGGIQQCVFGQALKSL